MGKQRLNLFKNMIYSNVYVRVFYITSVLFRTVFHAILICFPADEMKQNVC